METRNRIVYDAPVTEVVNLYHTGMLMTSEPVSATMNGTFEEVEI
jgi:hypothetical protein